MQKETGEDIVIDLGECDIVQVEPDDEVSTALAVCGDRLGHISLCHERLKERLHHAGAGLDLRRHPHASRLQEEAEKPVQMPSAAFGVLAVTARTGIGTVVVALLPSCAFDRARGGESREHRRQSPVRASQGGPRWYQPNQGAP